MSITPIDEPQSDRPVAADTEATSGSLRRRIRARLRSVVASLPLGERLLSRGDHDSPRPRPRAHTGGLADEAVRPPDCPSVPNLPDRQRPFTYPTRNRSEQNPVELVAVESDDVVTISLPENEDAKITSDVWERVEP